MSDFTFLEPVQREKFDSKNWSRKVQVGDKTYWVGVKRGKRVRIAFKPRGQNIGNQWDGYVRETGTNQNQWFAVPQSIGVAGLLEMARPLHLWRSQLQVPPAPAGVGEGPQPHEHPGQ